MTATFFLFYRKNLYHYLMALIFGARFSLLFVEVFVIYKS